MWGNAEQRVALRPGLHYVSRDTTSLQRLLRVIWSFGGLGEGVTMGKAQSFRKKGKVSVWVTVGPPDMSVEDVLKDLCGVDYYDIDDQETSAIDETLSKAKVDDVLKLLSYSSSFLEAALDAAAAKKITKVHSAIAQFDFAYKPERARSPVAPDPLFLGVFDWNDSEDDV